MMPSQNHLTFQWFNFATYHTIGGDPNHFSVEPLKLIILVTEGSDLCTAQKKLPCCTSGNTFTFSGHFQLLD
jgi:hypothetical protein